jgi:DNA replication protein DnaC
MGFVKGIATGTAWGAVAEAMLLEVNCNLPFDEWTSVFGTERLTGALLDRLTHHVHILELNGDMSFPRNGGHLW